MQDPICSPQSERLFQGRGLQWRFIDRADWPRLSIPDHLDDQVFRVLFAHTPAACYFEALVSEQFPKDAYAYLGKGASRLAASTAVVSVVHQRSSSAHLIFWRRRDTGQFHHMDIDHCRLSRFDQRVCERLADPRADALDQLFQLLEGQKLKGRAFFKTLQKRLREIECPNRDAYHALVDLALKLIFLIFVQRKGWLNFDPYYLEHKMTRCRESGLSVVRCFFKPLFARLEGGRCAETISLGELPRLGGGMFLFRPEHLPPIPNDWCLKLYRTLVSQHSFSLFEAREDRNVVGVSPEALGYVFENLLLRDDRKKQGVFYTPAAVAQKQARSAIDAYLSHNCPPGDKACLRRLLTRIRVLDPSCGSGAYLMAAFQTLLKLRLSLTPKHERYNGKLYALKRSIVLENLFGVDINPMAVRLAEVRLWLNMIQDLEIAEPAKAPALPSLQHHLRPGDFLSQHAPGDPNWIRAWPKHARLEALRKKFPTCAAAKRQATLKHIHRLERELGEHLRQRERHQAGAAAKASLAQATLPGCRPAKASRSRDRAREAQPAQAHVMFSRAMLDGGFDLILGNPPWLSASRLPAPQKTRILQRLLPPAGMALNGQVDLSLYFLAAALRLLKPNGHLGFLLPGKLLQARFAAGARHFLINRRRIDYLFDYGVDQGLVFRGDTFPLALGVSALTPRAEDRTRIERHGKNSFRSFELRQRDLAACSDIWPLGDAAQMAMFARTRDWPKLGDEPLRIERGVTTGAKRLFTFRQKPAGVPDDRFRPLLRGRDIRPNQVAPSAWLYWPFDDGPRWFAQTNRAERGLWRRAGRFQGEAPPKLGYGPRVFGPWLVAWKYLAKRWTAALYQGAWIPDQTVYFISFADFETALRYAVYFNTDAASDYLASIAERGKDRCRFYYAHTCGQLVLPPDLFERPIAAPEPRNLWTPAELRELATALGPIETTA